MFVAFTPARKTLAAMDAGGFHQEFSEAWRDLGFSCRNLIKKPWAFIRVPYMNPTILGLYAQGFLIRFLHSGWSSGLGFRALLTLRVLAFFTFALTVRIWG